MNIKRLLLAIVVGWVFIFASDFLIHGVWLMPDYHASATLWRTEAEMTARMPWMTAGQLLAVLCFVGLWAGGLAQHARGLGCAVGYGLLMGLFNQATTLINYAVWPLPPELAVRWFASGVAQAVLLGMLTFAVYRPARLAPPRSGSLGLGGAARLRMCRSRQRHEGTTRDTWPKSAGARLGVSCRLKQPQLAREFPGHPRVHVQRSCAQQRLISAGPSGA